MLAQLTADVSIGYATDKATQSYSQVVKYQRLVIDIWHQAPTKAFLSHQHDTGPVVVIV